MKIQRTLLTLALLAPMAAMAQIPWAKDYASARTKAKSSGKAVLAYFWRADSPGCVRMDQTTWKDPRVVAQLSSTVVPVRIDAAKEATLAKQLRVTVFPTMLYVDAAGKEWGRMNSFTPPLAFHD